MSSPTKIARVFQNGRSRAIRIPKEFEFDADEVEITRDDKGHLHIQPLRPKSLMAYLATLEPLSPEDWLPETEDPPPEPLDFDFGDQDEP